MYCSKLTFWTDFMSWPYKSWSSFYDFIWFAIGLLRRSAPFLYSTLWKFLHSANVLSTASGSGQNTFFWHSTYVTKSQSNTLANGTRSGWMQISFLNIYWKCSLLNGLCKNCRSFFLLKATTLWDWCVCNSCHPSWSSYAEQQGLLTS